MVADDWKHGHSGEEGAHHLVHLPHHALVPLPRCGPHVVRHQVAGPDHVVDVLKEATRRGRQGEEERVRMKDGRIFFFTA